MHSSICTSSLHMPPLPACTSATSLAATSLAATLRSAGLLTAGLLTAGLLCLAASPLAAQTSMDAKEERDVRQDSIPEPGHRLGVHADWQYNLHRSDMRGLPGTPSCCPQYDGGSGSGISVGAIWQIPLALQWSLQLRAGYAMHDAVQTAIENSMVLVAGVPVPARVEHRIDAAISSVGFEPLVGYHPFERFGVYAGPRVAYVLSSTFSQREELVEPANTGTFENDRRTRNVIDGAEIPGAASLYAGITALATYALPLSTDGNWSLVPELAYTVGLTDLADQVVWNADGFRAGVAVMYTLPREMPPPPPPPLPPPPPPPPPVIPPALAVSVTAVGLDRDGRELETPRVTIEEFESLRVRPLLSYVFFDENASSLPERYVQLSSEERPSFAADRLHDIDVVTGYHQLLNILGARMQRTPEALLRITGCNSNTGAESGNVALSRARAEAVASYLTRVWNIDASRLVVDARNLPASPSRQDDADGMAENRRVEISSDHPSILDPLVTRSVERVVQPDRIRFVPTVDAQAGVAAWTLTVERSGSVVHTDRGAGRPPASLDWDFAADLDSVRLSGDPLRYSLAVVDQAGQERTQTGEIEVRDITVRRKRENRIADRTINRFQLILFDYDSPQLGRRNERILNTFVRPEITPSSTVRITGYTDRIGEDAYNRTLSQQRALNAARVLRVGDEQAAGRGEEDPPSNNDLPEGRFYNRTVEVLVETPVK